MKTKLTLRLEKSLIEEAKEYAAKKGTSVSGLVADYFQAIKSQHSAPEDSGPEDDEIPPLTTSLSGIMKGSGLKEIDYKKYLDEKYLK